MDYINQVLLSLVPELDIPDVVPTTNMLIGIFPRGVNSHISTRKLKLSDMMADASLGELDSPAEKQLLFSVYQCNLECLQSFASLWKGKEAFKEIFTPSLVILQNLQNSIASSKSIKECLHPVAEEINRAINSINQLIRVGSANRVPLALQEHKPIPIPTYAPKFEENYNVDKKSYDPDVQRQEFTKLRAQVKKEKKAALRDLRKDSQFDARERIKDRRKKDEEYHEMLARLERSIQTEEGAEKNKYEREKRARKGKRK